MEPPRTASSRSVNRETRLGIVLRVAFFVGTVIVGLWIFSLVLSIFGAVIAATVGLFATGLVSNFLTMRIFDRRPLTDIGLGGGRGSRTNFLIGILFGAGAAALMLAAPLLAGTGHLVLRPTATFAWQSLAFYLAVMAFGAAGEEMIFRGYAFQLLVQKMGPFATVLPVGVVFGIVHNWNPHATSLGVLNTMLWGILLGYSFLRSRDLWLPIGLHYGWNTVLPLFGVESQRAYNRSNEVLLQMGSNPSLERRRLRTGGRSLGDDFRDRAVFCSRTGTDRPSNRMHCSGAQRTALAALAGTLLLLGVCPALVRRQTQL